MPLLGGIIVIANLFILSFSMIFFENLFGYLIVSKKEFASIIFFCASFFILGIYDDKFILNPDKKFIISIIFSILSLTLNKIY